MRDAGYPAVTAKNPKNLTESKGFQELTEAYLPDDMLLRALGDDIENKEGNRKAELELAFKVKGHLNRGEDGGNVAVQVNIGADKSKYQ